MKISTRLQQLTAVLPESQVTPGGLFRIHYGFRNPSLGIGLGLDGIDGNDLIDVYAEALDRAARILADWGWPEPRRTDDGCVPVYVFRTERMGFGDCPLTFTGEVAPGAFASQLALRSTFDDPLRNQALQRAAVEAAHEVAHAFAHQLVPPLSAIGDVWAWFDEATAVFVEGQAFPDLPEARRFALYWSHCPEHPLTAWGGFGGYFAAWFVRDLVRRFGPDLLREVWGGSGGESGPLEVLDRSLKERGARLDDTFWEYCCRGFAAELEPEVAERFGPRSLTEVLGASGGPPSRPAPIAPLSCRYYGIAWEDDANATPVRIRVDGLGDSGEARAALLTVGVSGSLEATDALERSDGGWSGHARRPPEGMQSVVLVARVLPPRVPRRAPQDPATVCVALGAETCGEPDGPPSTRDLAPPPALEGFEDATEYTFRDPADDSRINVSYMPPEEAGPLATASDHLEAYRTRLVDFFGAEVEFRPPARPIPPGDDVACMEFRLPAGPADGPHAPDERVAVVRLAEGGFVQVSVLASRDHPEADDWLVEAVEGIRLGRPATTFGLEAAATPEYGIAARRIGFAGSAASWPSPTFPDESRARRAGPVLVLIPRHLEGPDRYTLVSTDGAIRLDVPTAESIRVRARGASTAFSSPEAAPGITGSFDQFVEGARERFEAARASLASASGQEEGKW